MDKKQFLKQHPLEYSWPTTEAKAMKEVLKQAFESHGFEYTCEKGIKTGSLQYYDFKIYAYTTGFAATYARIGWLVREQVYPIWKARVNKPKKNKVRTTVIRNNKTANLKTVLFANKKYTLKNPKLPSSSKREQRGG